MEAVLYAFVGFVAGVIVSYMLRKEQDELMSKGKASPFIQFPNSGFDNSQTEWLSSSDDNGYSPFNEARYSRALPLNNYRIRQSVESKPSSRDISQDIFRPKTLTLDYQIRDAFRGVYNCAKSNLGFVPDDYTWYLDETLLEWASHDLELPSSSEVYGLSKIFNIPIVKVSNREITNQYPVMLVKTPQVNTIVSRRIYGFDVIRGNFVSIPYYGIIKDLIDETEKELNRPKNIDTNYTEEVRKAEEIWREQFYKQNVANITTDSSKSGQ